LDVGDLISNSRCECCPQLLLGLCTAVGFGGGAGVSTMTALPTPVLARRSRCMPFSDNSVASVMAAKAYSHSEKIHFKCL